MFGYRWNDLASVVLEPPFGHIVLLVRLDPEGWRFHEWKPAVGHPMPEEPPAITLGISFPTPQAAASFFTRVLTSPEEVVPPVSSCVPGLMPPAPQCNFYWPPTLETCVERYERDLAAPQATQVAIRRVLILGAGFSRAFQFSTSDSIVRAVALSAEEYSASMWSLSQAQRSRFWLDSKFPNWQQTPPTLYEFLDSFIEPGGESNERDFVRYNDPLALFNSGISWEYDSYDRWVGEGSHLIINHHHSLPYILSFNALLATHLLVDRLLGDVRVPWANKMFEDIEPTDAILTFNWDVIPEVLLTGLDKPFCRYNWIKERTKFIKLHGSIDLLGMPNSAMRGDMEANHLRFECITNMLWRARTADDVLIHPTQHPFGRPLWPTDRYNKSAVLIMPPYDVAGYGYRLIQFNWRKAQTALERAKEIYIIGYSIPDEDIAFHSLVSTVCRGWDPGVTVDVWNPDPKVSDRAKALFGHRHVIFHNACAELFHFR